MEESLLQTQIDRTGNVVLDMEALQPMDRCCFGSPKLNKTLSRKGSNRMERRNGEEHESDDLSKKLVVKVPSQLEQLKLPLGANKALVSAPPAATSPRVAESEGRSKKFNKIPSIHPRKILLLFATVSSVGTMILIYFTLSIYWRAGGR